MSTFCNGSCRNIALNNITETKKTSLMKKHNDRFENVRFQVKKKYILKSLDLKSKMRQKILFHMKIVDLSMVDESYQY